MGRSTLTGQPVTLDELTSAIEQCSNDALVRDLVKWIRDWKQSSDTVDQLAVLVERYIGHVWFPTTTIHDQISSAWLAFRGNEIANIGGMTMNERLFTFSLLGAFDAALESDRKMFYEKVLASL